MKRPLSDQDAPLRSDGSSNSMDNSTDTETDLGPSGAPSAQNTRQVREKMLGDGAPPSTPPLPPPPPPPPAKKKRTRTLTTPHQSAVLHALLAQSRFPTTAMREEVGRSIGLSARKVQVWFQASIFLALLVLNQRQKARRPRDSKNQGSPVAPARPPQYGAFPNVPAPPFLHSSASSTVIASSLPSDELYPTSHSPLVQFNVNHGQEQPASSSGRLSGPGVPGVAPRRQQQMQKLAPLADPIPREAHSISSSFSARQVVPSRDFTFNHPFPPLHLQVPETSGAMLLGGSQNQYPTMTPLRPLTASSHHPLGLSSSSSGRPRSQQTSTSSSPSSPPSPFTPASASASVSESRPQTPASSFLVPRRDLPRLQIPPLHVPESPHTNTNPHANNAHAHAHVQQQHVHVLQQQQAQAQVQRSALPRYSSPPLSLPLPPPHSHQDPARFSQPSDRALPSLLLSTTPRRSPPTSRGGGDCSPVPAHAHAPMSAPASASSSSNSRTRRFDPVREAASECSRSGSLGTDSMSTGTGTPPRIDTPQRFMTPFS
ncbi:hypothetical protein BJV77DRAFT_1067902 [Russula vinacea]|nr:hypothetical protein BJV77DRAFT_1067902 [Russula vinacea]